MGMIIEKIQGVAPRQELDVYEIKYTKEVETVDGKKALVIDADRIERVTVEQLEAQKASLQARIKEIDDKLLEIAELT